MRNLYVIGKKENKRKGQAEKVVRVVKEHGPISSLDICKRLAKEKKDCVLWNISQLKKHGSLKLASKKEAK